MWWVIWSLILVGTVIGAVLLVRLYIRAGKAFLKQLEVTTSITTRLDELVRELNEVQQKKQAQGFSPHLAASVEEKQQWRNTRAHIKQKRANRRELRLDKTLARWRGIGIPL